MTQLEKDLALIGRWCEKHGGQLRLFHPEKSVLVRCGWVANVTGGVADDRANHVHESLDDAVTAKAALLHGILAAEVAKAEVSKKEAAAIIGDWTEDEP